MKTAIIGTGNMGAGLARRLAGKRDLILASRNGAAAKSLAEEIGASSAPIATAVAEADIVCSHCPMAPRSSLSVRKRWRAKS